MRSHRRVLWRVPFTNAGVAFVFPTALFTLWLTAAWAQSEQAPSALSFTEAQSIALGRSNQLVALPSCL